MANRKKNRHGDTASLEQQAVAVAQAVDTAWQRGNNSGRRDVVLSVVATLAVVRQRDPGGDDLSEQFRAQSVDGFVDIARQIWTHLVNARPDLFHLVYPLMQWLFDDDCDHALRCTAKHTADAAVRAGQLDITGTDARYEVDLLGAVLTFLKSETARAAHGQTYTPNSIAALMARLNTPEEGTRVQDPAVGTGGLFRAAAEAMRDAGRDPTTVTWAGCDIDELAIAACAVNSILWDLGPRMLLCVGNSLSEGDWETRADRQRTEILQLTENIRTTKRMLGAVDLAQKLTELAAADAADQQPQSTTEEV
jgi:hypothetical protein